MSAQSYILILEDDPDQMDLFLGLVTTELQKLVDDEELSAERRSQFKQFGIIKVNNIETLKRVTREYNNVAFVILDCNVPERRGKPPEDQFIKKKHRITGQHRSVDIVINGFNSPPILLTSSMDRFKTIVMQYYRNRENLNLRFVRKSDLQGIQKAIEERLLSVV